MEGVEPGGNQNQKRHQPLTELRSTKKTDPRKHRHKLNSTLIIESTQKRQEEGDLVQEILSIGPV